MPDGRISVGIVEDEVLIATFLGKIVEAAGCVVTALAHTFEDAVALVERTSDRGVMFVDLFLNGRPTGVEVARRAAQKGWNVVIMTGAASLPDELPGARLLLKPFSAEQVETLLHTLGKDATER